MRPSLIYLVSCVVVFVTQAQEAPRSDGTLGRLRTNQAPVAIVYDKLQSPFGSEQHWIADQILRDIGEILLFAKDATTSVSTQLKLETRNDPAASPAFRVSAEAPAGRAEIAFELKHHLWSAEDYSPWATALITNWKICGSSNIRAVDPALMDALLNADIAVLIRQSKRISEELNRHPLDPELHDAAALILGCFALREASGPFNDTRSTLSRMTAHLAIARAIQPAEQEMGKLSRIIQLALVGRQKEAIDNITSLSPKHARWANALKLRATGDWRILKTPAQASSLEQLECFRALKQSGLSRKALTFLKEIHAPPSPDWNRIAMEYSLSVQEGHIFAGESLPMELASLAANWETFSGNSLHQPDVVELLNRSATRCVGKAIDGKTQLEVLSWGDLAAFHQRHICHSIASCDNFMRKMWGVPDTAEEFERVVDQELSGLTLYPIVKKQITEPNKAAASKMPGALTLWRDRPELLTACSQSALFLSMRMDVPGQPFPAPASDWFRPEIPFGTAHDLSRRCDIHPFSLSQKTLPFWTEISAIAPYDLAANRALVRANFGSSYSAEQLAQMDTPLRDFNINAMWDLADRAKEQPAIYEKIMAQICALEPDYFINLGNYFLDRQMLPQSTEAFQKAFDHATDRVYMANNCQWLVLYYFDNGRSEQAMKIAMDAAESYSSGGLQTMALLLEKMGKIAEAEEYYKKLYERYPSHKYEFTAFYIRNRRREPAYEQVAAPEAAKLFPAGFEKTTMADFTRAPLDGAMIKSPTARLEQAHLKPGNVIVAIDGMRVRTQKQYFLLRDLSLDPNMTLIVWDGRQYVECKVNVPGRRFNCDMADYHGYSTAAR